MIKRIAKTLGGLTLALLAIVATVYFFFPASLVEFSRSSERSAAGLTEHSATVAGHRIVYLQGGEGETVLLLHGFAADKDNWTRFARFLTGRYHVIAPDLPGFGDSDKHPDASYDVNSQVGRIEAFVQALSLDTFHLAGNSMGGHIALAYTHTYPERVATLGLFDSNGVTAPAASEFVTALLNGKNLLLVNDVEDFDRLLAFVFVVKPDVPRPVMRYLAEKSVEGRAFNDMIFGQLMVGYVAMEPILAEVSQPTLVLWGGKDRVIDVSAATVFAEAMPNAELAVMPDVGHLPMIEKPRESAALYLDFIARQ